MSPTQAAPSQLQNLVRDRIHDVPDFPTPGILFRDISPLLADATAFSAVTSHLADVFGGQVDAVAGIEARGFLFAAPLAAVLGCSLIAVRKAGKLPPPVRRVDYSLEYGTASLEINAEVVGPGSSVAILDDVLATGGTAAAACELIEAAGGSVAGLGFIAELTELDGRQKLTDRVIHTVLRY